MATPLTPGRWRGLKTTSLADQDLFGILAFDQRGSYRKMLPEGASYNDAVKIKEEIVGSLTRYASAVLLDPIYGLNPAMQMTGKSGLLMALEKSGYTGDATARYPEFIDAWNVEKIHKMGASAVKILVYYNPQSGELAEELEELIRQKTAEVHAHDLPVFLEPMSYSLDESADKGSAEFAALRREIIVDTARRLGKTGVDILKLEFPLDYQHSDESEWRAACEEVSEVSDVPWVLLSAGVDFETFEQQTIAACEGGASGFLAGRAIWKEAVAMSPAERAEFLDGKAADRIKRLLDITATKGRAWSDFYTAPEGSEDWYIAYGE
jgi:tagatose 1,6-diphosphate aldolase